jgi:hypothetical protein
MRVPAAKQGLAIDCGGKSAKGGNGSVSSRTQSAPVDADHSPALPKPSDIPGRSDHACRVTLDWTWSK